MIEELPLFLGQQLGLIVIVVGVMLYNVLSFQLYKYICNHFKTLPAYEVEQYVIKSTKTAFRASQDHATTPLHILVNFLKTNVR